MEFDARAPMAVVVSIAVLHVEAVILLDARGSTGTFTAHFLTDTVRAGGNCQ